MKLNHKTSIQSRILYLMMGLILVVFILVISIFNLLVTDFIHSNVKEQLSFITRMVSEDNSFLQRRLSPSDQPPNGKGPNLFPDMRRVPRESIGKADTMILSENYEIIFPDKEMIFIRHFDEIRQFAEELKQNKVNLSSDEIRKHKTMGREYYYVSIPIPERVIQNPSYFIYMEDMTSISTFSNRINLVLILVMLVTCFLAAASAIFLSGVIVKPIKDLTQFAERIGNGDFSRSSHHYKDLELSKLAESMNKAAHQLDTYDQEQKVFFQNASHELRTPLQAIKCNIEGIQKGILPVQTSSEVIIKETDRLTEMVDDLLYTSYIDTTVKGIQWEELDLREIFSNSVERLSSIIKEKKMKVSFEFDEQPVLMRCDEKRLNRAFTNILSNAIRYARANITLSCHRDPEKIEIVVIDDGEGISEKDLPHIFTRFYAGKNGNHGIGLSIVKSIIEQHHGTIKVQSSPSGSRFMIQFPQK